MPDKLPNLEKVPSAKRFGKRRLLAVGLVLIFVLVSILSAVYFVAKPFDKKPSAICSEATLREASSALSPASLGQLKPIAEKVMSTKNYDKDPNCMYIVLTYHTNNDQPAIARSDLEKLRKMYDPTQGFSSYLGPNPKDLTALEADINFRETTLKETEANTLTFPENP